MRCQLDRGDLDVRLERGLGRSVGRLERLGADERGRADGEDRAVALCDEASRDLTAAPDARGDVGREGLLPTRGGHPRERLVPRAGRDVHVEVEAAEGGDRFVDDPHDLVLERHVRLEPDARDAERTELRDDVGPSASSTDRHVDALGSERERDGSPDA